MNENRDDQFFLARDAHSVRVQLWGEEVLSKTPGPTIVLQHMSNVFNSPLLF